jgi:hypothetical protein
MQCTHLRCVAFAAAVALPSTGRAAEPVPGDPASSYGPERPPEAQPLTEPAPTDPLPAEPPPIEATPSVAPPVAASAPVEPPPLEPAQRARLDDELQRAELTRDAGGSILIGSGVVTIVGLVLIFAGTGVGTAEVRRAGCSDPDLCDLDDRKMMHAGRTLFAGFAISGLGALGLIGGIAAYVIGGIAAYANGKYRVERARATLGGFAVAPSSRGVSVGVRGRF